MNYKRALLTKVAELTDEDARILYEYWGKLLGEEYATDETTDYQPAGKSKKVSASKQNDALRNELMEKLAALDAKTLTLIKKYWGPLLGAEYAADEVKDYSPKGKTKTVKS